MGELKTHSPKYITADKIIGRIDLILEAHSDRMYMTSILGVHCLQMHLHIDDDEVVQCANKRIRPPGYNVLDHLFIP